MNTKFLDSAIVRRGPRALGVEEVPQLIFQDPNSKICGPTCVAMALDCRPDHLLSRMKSKGGGTRAKQLVMALKEFYDVDDRLTVVNSIIPSPAILKITIDGRKQGHWVLLWHDFVYDPGWGVFPRQMWEDSFRGRGCRITSFLELKRKNAFQE